jgi:hypothetical protein
MSMKTVFQRSRLLGAVLTGLLMAACSPAKDPAQMAIADAETALQKVSADGQKYAPAEYASVNEQVIAMKAAFDKKDYEGVLNRVRKLVPDVRLLAETIADKKSEASKAQHVQWSNLSRDLPKSLLAVEARVAELKKTRKLPKGVSKDALVGASAELDAAKQSWSDAQSAQTAKNLEDAVAKGKTAETKVSGLMASLGMGGANAPAK